MPEFRYIALDRTGKQVKGDLAGRDVADVAAKVRALGLFPVSVDGQGAAAARPATSSEETVAPSGKKVSRVLILLFTRELSDLIDAGLPIDRALSVLIEQSDSPQLREMVRAMQQDVRAGQPLSEALRRFPREFPDLYANMVRAGEVSGQLPQVLSRLADFLEKEHIRRAQVMSALTYPAVLISVAVLAIVFLLTFVIPRLRAVFTELGASLPLPTQMLLGVSAFIARDWWIIVLAGLGGFFGLRAWGNTKPGRYALDGIRLHAPLMGILTRKMVMGRFVRTLGTLLGGGVPILDSLDISATAVGNMHTAQAIADVRAGVRQGETLSSSMEKNGGFLPLVVHMTAVGEETGRLSNMLVRTADTLDFEVDNAMRRITSLVEPLVVLAMGIFVGFVVLSILLPIFESSSIVK